MDREVLLVRYATQAANRRHFDLLFFAVVAFTWCFGLAAWATIFALSAASASAALFAAGAILCGGSFVARRLMLRERAAFEAMIGTWNAIIGGEPATTPERMRPGAMAIATAGLCFVGLLSLAAAAASLL